MTHAPFPLRLAALLLLFVGACRQAEGSTGSVMSATPASPEVYGQRVGQLEARRQQLARQLSLAPTAPERARVIAAARSTLVSAIVEDLLPAWSGTPWSYEGTAKRPGADPIACGYFVATVLQDAGVHLSSRVAYAQAPALRIQRSLTPDPTQLTKIYSVPARRVASRIRALGAGLYLVGLNVHVAFAVVDDQGVWLVHSSYTNSRRVVREPLATAKAIRRSRKAGYFVTPLFRDEASVVKWLKGETFPLQTG